MPDPRQVANDERDDLHAAVVKAATHVDWVHTDVLLIWLAQSTGWWGGGTVLAPDGVTDYGSPYSTMSARSYGLPVQLQPSALTQPRRPHQIRGRRTAGR